MSPDERLIRIRLQGWFPLLWASVAEVSPAMRFPYNSAESVPNRSLGERCATSSQRQYTADETRSSTFHHMLYVSLIPIFGLLKLTLHQIYTVASIIASRSSNMPTLIGMRCLQASGSSAVVAVGAGSLADMFEVHERGQKVSETDQSSRKPRVLIT